MAAVGAAYMKSTVGSVLRGVATACVATAAVSASQAAVLYSESTGGDLSGNQGSPTLVGNFSAGLNTADGTANRGTDNVPAGVGDGLAIRLLAGQTLETLDLVLSNFTGTGTLIATLFRAPLGGQTFLGLQQMQIPATQVGTFTFTPPSFLQTPSANDYIVGLSLQYIFGPGPLISTDWQWRATVGQTGTVPEPASLALVLVALGAAGWRTGRRRAAARR